MKWEELWSLYRQHLLALARSQGTVWRRQWEMKRFFQFCQRRRLTLEKVTTQTIRDYDQELREVPGGRGKIWNEISIVAALRALLTFFDWAVEHRFMLLHPAPDMTLRKPPPPPLKPLTTVDVLQILEAPDASTPEGQRDRAILELIYSTGVRRRECHQLNLTDLDLVRRQLAVHKGKGGRSRLLPVGEHLAEVMQDYLDRVRPLLRPLPGESALFISSQNGRRLSLSSFWARMQYACEAIGVKTGVHALRHAFASHLLEGGADVRHVQEMLGHSRVSTTQRYTQLQPLELIREHRHTHPRGRKKT
jgi:integrase/recombinase XerD